MVSWKKQLIGIAIAAAMLPVAAMAESAKQLTFQDPVRPYYLEEGERVFQLNRKTTFVTKTGRGKIITGWLPKGEPIVGQLDPEKKNWEAVRIYKCGNPILEPKNLRLGKNRVPVDSCDDLLRPSDAFLWVAGPGLIAYGIGDDASWATTSGQVLSGLAVLNLTNKRERQWCQLKRKFILGTVASTIGYLVGKNQREKRERYTEWSPSKEDGPGPPPPNVIAVNLSF